MSPDPVALGFNPGKQNWTGRGHYVGSRRIIDGSQGEQLKSEPEVLALELTPLVDDGKHWRILTDGVVEREAIDPSLADLYDVTIVFPGAHPSMCAWHSVLHQCGRKEILWVCH